MLASEQARIHAVAIGRAIAGETVSARKRWVLQEAWEIATNFVQLGKFGVGGEADHWIAFGQKAARLLMHATADERFKLWQYQ